MTNYAFCVFKFNRSQHGYLLGDWLVNWSAGFVRRGFGGELAKALATVTGLGLAQIVLLVQIFLCVSFFILFLMLILDKEKPFWFMLFVFSPATFLFTVIDAAAVGRKEIVLYVFLAAYINVLTKTKGFQNQPLFLFACMVLSAVATLWHELFFFFTPYFFAAEWLSGKRVGPYRLRSAFFMFLGSLVAMLAIVFIGSRIDGGAICRDLVAHGLKESVCMGELSYDQGLARNMTMMSEFIFNEDYFAVYGSALLFGAMPLIVGYFQCKKIDIAPEKLAIFLVASVIFSSPLYIMAADWGRWISITFTCTLLLGTFFLEAAKVTRVNSLLPPDYRAKKNSL